MTEGRLGWGWPRMKRLVPLAVHLELGRAGTVTSRRGRRYRVPGRCRRRAALSGSLGAERSVLAGLEGAPTPLRIATMACGTYRLTREESTERRSRDEAMVSATRAVPPARRLVSLPASDSFARRYSRRRSSSDRRAATRGIVSHQVRPCNRHASSYGSAARENTVCRPRRLVCRRTSTFSRSPCTASHERSGKETRPSE